MVHRHRSVGVEGLELFSEGLARGIHRSNLQIDRHLIRPRLGRMSPSNTHNHPESVTGI